MKRIVSVCTLLAAAACGSSGSSTTSSTTGATSGVVNGATSGTSGATHGSTSGSTTYGATTGTGSGAGATSGSSGTTSGSTTTVGTPCTVDPTSGVDSCAAAGYECTGEIDGSGMGTCVLPEDYGTCTTKVGCQDGGVTLVCTSNVFQSPTCLQPCMSSSNCTVDVLSYCATQVDVCVPNECDFTVNATTMQPTFVGPYFNTCDANNGADGGGGQCLPFDTGANEFGLCIANGTAANGALCSSLRGGNQPLCADGEFCLPSQSSDAGMNGACVPLTDGGNCPTGDLSSPFYSNGDWALCLTQCDGGASCPANFNCLSTGMGSSQFICVP